MGNEKVVLAYSGSLNTSCILKWLIDEEYEVICYMANIGQKEDFQEAEAKATKIGASKVVIEDVREDFASNYVWPAISYGLLYESRHLLGTSLARACISVGLVKCAKENDATHIAHGATGKENDQVRFELSCYALYPEVKIIAPWREEEFTSKFEDRKDLLKYAEQNDIPVSATPKARWSTNTNLMEISYESGILENPANEPPKDMYEATVSPHDAPNKSSRIELEFKEGLVRKLTSEDGKIHEKPLDIFLELNKIGAKHGVGRIDIMENRFIGRKSRRVYETPGGTILHMGHTDMETFCLDKRVYRVKQYLRDQMSDYVFDGFWFSPEGKYVRRALDLAQETVEGSVKIEVYKGSVYILGRSSENSLCEDLASKDKQSNFNPEDVTGFVNIQAIRLKEYSRCQNQKE